MSCQITCRLLASGLVVAATIAGGARAESTDHHAGASNAASCVDASTMPRDGACEAVKQAPNASAVATKKEASAADAPRDGVAPPAASTSTADGGEVADAVTVALRRYTGQLSACYESRLKRNPKLSGQVVLELHVEGGKVKSASIAENTTGDPALGSCITSRARHWRLPAGAYVLPFTFEGV